MKTGACKCKVEVFKIKNRKGFAAICCGNLTEGATRQLALDRMEKALKRKDRSGHPLF